MNIRSQQRAFGSLIIIILLLLAAIPTLMFVNLIDIAGSAATPPIVSTSATTNINSVFATLNGYLQSNGSARTWYGFRYGLSSDSLTNNVTIGTDGTNYTAFDYVASGLNEGTVHFVQAWANNSNSFSNGTVETFWTNSTWANSSLNNRTRIVINNTFIDEDLYDFPVLVTINSTISQCCNDGNSIRFYKNSTVQYYYEIDTWNNTENSSVWVNVTHVYDDVDTVFYLYYNDTNAVSNSTGVNTWNGHFVAVYHMNESAGNLIDSTSNGNDGTFLGNLPSKVVGAIGGGQDLTVAGSDYISLPVGCHQPVTHTWECWFKADAIDANHYLITDVLNGGNLIQFEAPAGNNLKYRAWISSVLKWDIASVVTYGTTWRYCAAAVETSNAILVLDGAEVGSNNTAAPASFGFLNIFIGKHGTDASFSDMVFDETRISNIVRSAAWLKASFHSQNQTTGFLTFTGEIEEGPPSDAFLINGLTSNRITWLGQPNSYVWCNATGTANETMELNMTINVTTNITQIYVWIGDSNNTGEYLNASNISAVFSSDNSTWNTIAVNTTSFVDGGSNVTLNVSSWTDTNGMYGTNPFNETGLTDKTASIFCRFRLNILTTQPVDIYWNSTTWRIYFGYIV